MLALLKLALGIQDDSQDDVLNFTLCATTDQVLNYLNSPTLPPELSNILVLIAASWFKSAAPGSLQPPPGPLTALSRGDASSSFAPPAAPTPLFDLASNSFFGYKTALSPFRKLRYNYCG